MLQLGVVFSLALILLIGLALSVQWADQAQARPLAGQTPQPSPTPVPRGKNLFYNGSFELGYYPVPELGFEPDEIGNIPHYWGWFKSNTFGKYDIDNNEGFRLVCPEDEELLWGSFNALAVYMQSTDQADARLGIYQTVDVVPGKDYLFSISGTIQAQSGASSPDINHRVQLAFDHTGGTDWTAIPFEEWTILPWREQLLEFSLSGPEDPDLAQVESFYTTVRARSNKMTVFIAAWRRWANWRSGVFTFDCAYLVPLDQIDPYTLTLILTEYSTTDVDVVVESSPMAVRPDAAPTPAPGATPAAAPAVAPAEPAPHPIDIPDSGGILETKRNTLLFIAAAIVIIVGLVGAGIWNIRRQKRQN
ncbi:MAG: hypothetical protein JW953_05455 [Anaerolineae bacterium]|nr:hypothetical protein [Anaerolineae bacterium]